jgi:tetratricopeptide (TPR) repeat protein
VELDGSDPEALERLGTAERLLFQYAEGAAAFEKGIARFPRYARMYAACAKLLLDPGARSNAAAEARAIALLEKALALEPSLGEAHYELGKLLLEGGKAPEALGHLEWAAKLDPSNGATHLALASAYRLLARGDDQTRELQIYRELEAQKAR